MDDESQNRFSVHLTLDPHPDSGRYHGQIAPGLAIFVESAITYQDLFKLKAAKPITARKLCTAFFDAAGTVPEKASSRSGGKGDLEMYRLLLIEAAREAFDRFPEAAEKRIGYLVLSLLFSVSGDRWRVFNIGSNLVLKIACGGVSQVVEPNSALFDPNLDSSSPAAAAAFAGVSTAVLEPELRFAGKLRAAEVELRPGDWLVVAPGSAGAADLRLRAHPNTLSEIEREVIGRLAASAGTYPKSWLTVQALPLRPAL